VKDKTEAEQNAIGIHQNLGISYNALGDFSNALSASQRQLDCGLIAKDQTAQCRANYGIGMAYNNMFKYDDALSYLTKSTEQAESIGFQRIVCESFMEMGRAFSQLGRFEEAVASHRKCVAAAQQMGDKFLESHAYGDLGQDLDILGKSKEAAAALTKSIELAELIGNAQLRDLNRCRLASTYADLGRNKEAETLLTRLMNMAKTSGDAAMLARSCLELGQMRGKLGRLAEAQVLLKQSFQAAHMIPDRGMKQEQLCNVLILLGNNYVQNRETPEARATLMQALALAQVLNNVMLISKANNALALLDLAQSGGPLVDSGHKCTLIEARFASAQKMGDVIGQCKACVNLGSIFLNTIEEDACFFAFMPQRSSVQALRERLHQNICKGLQWYEKLRDTAAMHKMFSWQLLGLFHTARLSFMLAKTEEAMHQMQEYLSLQVQVGRTNCALFECGQCQQDVDDESDLGPSLLTCGACGVARYCDKAHQEESWNCKKHHQSHKIVCPLLKRWRHVLKGKRGNGETAEACREEMIEVLQTMTKSHPAEHI